MIRQYFPHQKFPLYYPINISIDKVCVSVMYAICQNFTSQYFPHVHLSVFSPIEILSHTVVLYPDPSSHAKYGDTTVHILFVSCTCNIWKFKEQIISLIEIKTHLTLLTHP